VREFVAHAYSVKRFTFSLGRQRSSGSLRPPAERYGAARRDAILAELGGVGQQNNGAELLAMVAGLRIALESGGREVRSDSDPLVRYWSRGYHNAIGDPRKALYSGVRAATIRARGGAGVKISGGANLAELGFRRS
jgi:hypothetical protein